MRHFLRLRNSLPLASVFLLISFYSSGQPLPQYTAQQQAKQLEIQRIITADRAENYQRALNVAQKLGRPLQQRRSDGTVVILSGISETGELLYNTTYSATQAGQSLRTSSLYSGGSLGVSLSGSTLSNKIAIWDGGKVRSTHVEFKAPTGTGSRITQVDNATALSEHSTHVSGIIMAAGVNPQVRGMAFGTNLRAYDFENDATEMTSAAPNLLVSNHSYGSQAGWIYNSDRKTTTKWEWWGDTTVSKTEDYKFGVYNSTARSWDQIAQNAPYYLIVKSAGNNHGSNGPTAGQPYYLSSSDVISTVPRANQNGYDQVGTYGTAKNILSVAAASILPYGYNQPADVVLGGFSSWGPTDDGRIKPDIAGIGVGVLSSISTNDSAYAAYDGTSMSSPTVAGSALLLQELYSQRNNGSFMRSSTLRGLILHTADEAGTSPGPDYRFGWGLMNTERAGQVILNTNKNYLLNERTINQGETYSLTVVASGRGPLMASICWTDPAGTATNALNERTPRLVNDLDLRVSDGTTTTQPWVLDPANPANSATRGDNVRDNIEQVLVANPIPGKTYTLTVTHKGTLSGAKQDYALLLSGIGGTASCVSRATSTADTKISRVQFNTIDQAGATGCTAYTDFSGVTTSVQARQQIPLIVSLGTCGATKNAAIKAFIDWNQNGSFDDAGETVATSTVLTNSSQFTATITVPTTVQPGQILRFRIVATETDNAANVTSCGTYANGETQDYVLNVIQTTNDVGTTALVSPEANFCSQPGQFVTVRVRNYGAATQTNVPVSVTITDANSASVATLTGTVPSIAAFRETTLSLALPTGTVLQAGQTYQFAITTSLPNDLNATNNTLAETRSAALASTGGIFSAMRCGSDTLSLRNAGSGVAYWYDAPTGGNLLAAGNQQTLRTLPAGGQLYAGLNDFSGMVGPVSKSAFGGGSYAGNFGPAPLVSTQVPLLIESARLYIAAAGKLTFTVQKYDNTVVSSVTLDVQPTRSQSLTAVSNGQLVDDPNDPGAVYPLNLRIPATGDYKIAISYADGASIFRSNVGVTGFPFQLTAQNGTPLVSVKGSLYDNGTTMDTLKTAWYYFYDMRVRALDCAGPQRVAVPATSGTTPVATLTANGSTSICQGSSLILQAGLGTSYSYQWYRDAQAISGATSSTLSTATAGSYAVQIANGCPPVRSSTVAVVVQTPIMPIITTSGLTLTTSARSNIQWLLNGVSITDATSTSLTVVQSGRYSVRGSVNGCGELISDETYVTILAAEPTVQERTLSVYPIPATHQITVSLMNMPMLSSTPIVRLTDLRGVTVRTAPLQRNGVDYSVDLDIGDLPGGTFLVVINDQASQSIWVKRIKKQ
ncbi:GEVED domain-containing protein [Spirosoma sp. KUDC1026]|uniref:GEVED domain-containing protein n=1 Tax=Spirosoma sp. KUDC1026 TaxID=2745947 RepID=UPI00159BEF28|nr:GEVED domain-containing protein [Spirosoma sp. KUDC1026]QKZ12040.1 S8 family serine peptidase [Spirosoma sp. KUDC1026]